MKSHLRSTDRQRSRSVSRPGALLGVAALIASSVTAAGMPVAAFAAPANLIQNGTFESGLSGWSAPLGGTLAESTDARTGTKALAINARSSFQSGPTATVTGLLKTDQS